MTENEQWFIALSWMPYLGRKEKMRSIKEILMERDGLDEDTAEELIQQAKDEFHELLEEGRLLEAEDICRTHFGLEPDYLEEFF